jgi:tRNA A37 N6-isopentenylltransferase MiaA
MTETELLDEDEDATIDPNHERRLVRAREIADHARRVWDSMTTAEHNAVLTSMARRAQRAA